MPDKTEKAYTDGWKAGYAVGKDAKAEAPPKEEEDVVEREDEAWRRDIAARCEAEDMEALTEEMREARARTDQWLTGNIGLQTVCVDLDRERKATDATITTLREQVEALTKKLESMTMERDGYKAATERYAGKWRMAEKALAEARAGR
jgi:chromosome segregation ATPase